MKAYSSISLIVLDSCTVGKVDQNKQQIPCLFWYLWKRITYLSFVSTAKVGEMGRLIGAFNNPYFFDQIEAGKPFQKISIPFKVD